MRLLAALSVCALVSAIASCADSSSDSATDSQPPRQLTPVEQQRIGSRDDPNIGFSNISGVDLDAAGNIYVFESRDAQIRVYSPDGSLLRTIGRRGRGPGEFTLGATFGVMGDSLWAIATVGIRSQAIYVFDLKGQLLSTATVQGHEVPLPGGRKGTLMPTAELDGTLRGSITLTTGLITPEMGVADLESVRVPRLRWNLQGQVVDTVGWYTVPPPPPPNVSGPARVQTASGTVNVPLAPVANGLTVLLPDAVLELVVDEPANDSTGRFIAILIDSQLDTVWTRQYTYDAYPYDSDALDALAWRAARSAGPTIIINGVPGPREAPADSTERFAAVRTAMQFPAWQRPFGQSFLGVDGSIWLRRYDARPERNTWWVFNPDGTIRGQVDFPTGMRLLRADDTEVWGALPDEMDVPWLIRYSIQNGGD